MIYYYFILKFMNKKQNLAQNNTSPNKKEMCLCQIYTVTLET